MSSHRVTYWNALCCSLSLKLSFFYNYAQKNRICVVWASCLPTKSTETWEMYWLTHSHRGRVLFLLTLLVVWRQKQIQVYTGRTRILLWCLLGAYRPKIRSIIILHPYNWITLTTTMYILQCHLSQATTSMRRASGLLEAFGWLHRINVFHT